MMALCILAVWGWGACLLCYERAAINHEQDLDSFAPPHSNQSFCGQQRTLYYKFCTTQLPESAKGHISNMTGDKGFKAMNFEDVVSSCIFISSSESSKEIRKLDSTSFVRHLNI